MKILFLHGWQSTPGGLKPKYLAAQGYEVLNPALPDDDFGAAVRIAQAEFDRHRPDVIVGSSRGGAVAMNFDSRDAPLVLLCPAWKHWGAARTVKPGTVILHSPDDETIPFADSLELLRASHLPESSLVAIGSDHRLADLAALEAMLKAIESVRVDGGELPHEAGVPRRFGMGVLLVITAMYAVLFGVMRGIGANPITFVLVTLFFTAVGTGQMLLFRGRQPRWASMVAGAAACPLLYLGGIIYYRLAFGLRTSPDICGGFTCGVIAGAIYGYLAGVLIAGVFLIADWLAGRARHDRRRR